MSKPYSRQTLVDYCLRALGAPVIEINVDDDQLGDRLDEALQFYQEYHSDAVIKRFRKYVLSGSTIELDTVADLSVGMVLVGNTTGAAVTITAISGNTVTYTDVEVEGTSLISTETLTPRDLESVFNITSLVKGDMENKYITIPDTFITISRVLPFNSNTGGTGDFNIEYQMMLNDMYDLAKPGASMLNYSMTQQHLALIDHMFDGKDQTTRFNRHINRLYIESRWGTDLRLGQTIVFEGYEAIVPKTSHTADTYGSGSDTSSTTEPTSTKVYNDMFLKKYLTALIKRQWGINIKKFDGMQLPGGVTMNGQQIYDEANEEILKIEEEVQLKYEMPPAFYVG